MATSAAFTATVSAITDAFGDPTRRRIYLFVRDPAADDGVTAAAVADEVGVHPNVARHHLDKLAAGGYLEVRVRQGRRRAERSPVEALLTPSPTRSPSSRCAPTISCCRCSVGRSTLLAPNDAEAMAEEVGAEYGRAMAAGLTGDALDAGHRSMRSAMQAVADALTAHGFAAHAESRNDRLRIINDHCPFGDVALEHPVICAVDRGMVRGMLSELYDGELGVVTTESSRPAGDTFCTTAV